MPERLLISCPRCRATNRVPAARLTQAPRCGACKQPLFAAAAVDLDAATFDTLIANTDIPVVVDFWAPWCGPCRMMAPVFAAAAAELEPHYRLARIDTEAEQVLAARHHIRSIPTLAIFRQGREVARQPGTMSLPQLLAWVRQVH